MGVLKTFNLTLIFFIFTIIFNMIIAGFFIMMNFLDIFLLIIVLAALLVVITSLKLIRRLVKMPQEFISYLDIYFNAIFLFIIFDFIASLIFKTNKFGDLLIEIGTVITYTAYIILFKLYFIKSPVIKTQFSKNLEEENLSPININKLKEKII